jgi:hypothetical protein
MISSLDQEKEKKRSRANNRTEFPFQAGEGSC